MVSLNKMDRFAVQALAVGRDLSQVLNLL
jgi:hypothetical protein